MIGCAETRFAPITAESPTPPQAKIATPSPGRTLARRVTDITPVVTPQPEQAGELEVERGIDRQRAVRGHDRVARERRDVGEVVDALAVAREPARAVAQEAGVEAGRGVEAEVGAALEAEAAGAAGRRERQHDALADARRDRRPRRPPRSCLRPRARAPSASAPATCRRRRRGRCGRCPSPRSAPAPRRDAGGSSSRSATSSGRFGAVKTAARILMRRARRSEGGAVDARTTSSGSVSISRS